MLCHYFRHTTDFIGQNTRGRSPHASLDINTSNYWPVSLGRVAQLVERRTPDSEAPGSNPSNTQLFFFFFFFLVHLSRRLKCTIVIMRCPSSVCRPSSLTFHIFDFSSETTERNSTKLYRKVDLNVLYQVCVFRADRKNKMAALASDWLRHFRLLL